MRSSTTNTAAEALRGGRRLWYSSRPHPLNENRPTSVNRQPESTQASHSATKKGKKIKEEDKKKEPRHAHTQPLDSLRGLAAPKIIARCPQSSVDSEEEGLGRGGWETSKVNKGGLTWGQPCTTATFGWSGGGGGLDAGMMHKYQEPRWICTPTSVCFGRIKGFDLQRQVRTFTPLEGRFPAHNPRFKGKRVSAPGFSPVTPRACSKWADYTHTHVSYRLKINERYRKRRKTRPNEM